MAVSEVVELTDAEVKNLCRKVTPEIRAFCQKNMNGAEWPEIWLQSNVTKFPEQSFEHAPPYTVEQWWIFIFDRIVTPDPNTCLDEAQ